MARFLTLRTKNYPIPLTFATTIMLVASCTAGTTAYVTKSENATTLNHVLTRLFLAQALRGPAQRLFDKTEAATETYGGSPPPTKTTPFILNDTRCLHTPRTQSITPKGNVYTEQACNRYKQWLCCNVFACIASASPKLFSLDDSMASATT